jgi:hypothetical protein
MTTPTKPEKIAVALEYEDGGAPVVSAKGTGSAAQRIEGATGDWEIVIGLGSPCPGEGHLRNQAVFRRLDRIRRRAE